jgi:hypothetical protein
MLVARRGGPAWVLRDAVEVGGGAVRLGVELARLHLAHLRVLARLGDDLSRLRFHRLAANALRVCSTFHARDFHAEEVCGLATMCRRLDWWFRGGHDGASGRQFTVQATVEGPCH